MDQEFMTYCPRCGYMDDSEKEPVCFFCYQERIPTEMSIDVFKRLNTGARAAWRTEIMSKVIVKNPMFDYTAKKDREEADLIRIRRYIQSSPPQTRCPHCQSTSFQMVPRKWSLMTGFMTNKVDRVCTNCKKRF